jgi:hypothetical protein
VRTFLSRLFFLGLVVAAVARPAHAAPSAAFSVGRLKYGGGGDWYSDQTSMKNLIAGCRERLGLKVAADDAEDLALLDEALFRHPFLFMSGHGNVRFTPAEVERLHSYLIRGGFLWCDDDYGIDASFRREMHRVFPDQNFVELPFSHPIFHQKYDFPGGLPKIHEHDGGPARAFALFSEGRLVVLYTFDTDLGDGIEDEGIHPDPPEKREQALRMALNIVSYVLTN